MTTGFALSDQVLPLFRAHPPFGGVEVRDDGEFVEVDWSGHDNFPLLYAEIPRKMAELDVASVPQPKQAAIRAFFTWRQPALRS